MLDFSQPLFPAFPADPAETFHRALQKDLACVKTVLTQADIEQVYFLNSETLAGRNLLFESFYTAYLLAPKILVNSDTTNLFAITIIDPQNTAQLLLEQPYELVKKCGNAGVLVLKRKTLQP